MINRNSEDVTGRGSWRRPRPPLPPPPPLCPPAHALLLSAPPPPPHLSLCTPIPAHPPSTLVPIAFLPLLPISVYALPHLPIPFSVSPPSTLLLPSFPCLFPLHFPSLFILSTFFSSPCFFFLLLLFPFSLPPSPSPLPLGLRCKDRIGLAARRFTYPARPAPENVPGRARIIIIRPVFVAWVLVVQVRRRRRGGGRGGACVALACGEIVLEELRFVL